MLSVSRIQSRNWLPIEYTCKRVSAFVGIFVHTPCIRLCSAFACISDRDMFLKIVKTHMYNYSFTLLHAVCLTFVSTHLPCAKTNWDTNTTISATIVRKKDTANLLQWCQETRDIDTKGEEYTIWHKMRGKWPVHIYSGYRMWTKSKFRSHRKRKEWERSIDFIKCFDFNRELIWNALVPLFLFSLDLHHSDFDVLFRLGIRFTPFSFP